MSNILVMFLQLHMLNSLKAHTFRYVCVDVGHSLLQVHSFIKKFSIFYTLKQMLGQ